MSASNAFETSLLALILNGTAIINLADNTATSPATQIYVGLHTADPGEAGTQATSEATYTSYARVTVSRASGGWTISGNTASNTAVINFPACTGGSNTITHFSLGLASTGVGTLLFSGPLGSSINISNGITPSFNPGTLTVTAD